MGAVEIGIVIILGIVGLGVLGVFLSLLFSPFTVLFRGGKGHVRLSKAARKLKKIDQLIELQRFDSAIRELRKSLFADISGSEKLIRDLRDFHQNILSRCMVIAEQVESQLESLPEMETLLLERMQLLSLFENTHQAYHNVSEKRSRAGKPLPAWSRTDYNNRISQVRGELARNLRDLAAAFDKLFTSKKNSTGQITYH